MTEDVVGKNLNKKQLVEQLYASFTAACVKKRPAAEENSNVFQMGFYVDWQYFIIILGLYRKIMTTSISKSTPVMNCF